MLHIKNLEEGLPVFKALGSDLRIKIIKLLLENREMNINELAGAIGVTNGAMTSHIRKLEESGIVKILPDRRCGHGNQKVCRVDVDKILVDVVSNELEEDGNVFITDIPVGQYMDYDVYPTCGLATETSLIGEADDPRYFAHPDRVHAQIIWFGKGYVEYTIPTLLPPLVQIEQITLSLEISSEAPGINNDWPSDIYFYLNGENIGMWTSPGDFGDVRGIFTPDWWLPNWNQYGLLKMITINKEGTFVDGLKISNTSIKQFDLDYKSTIRFRFEVPQDAKNVGGMTIFGRKFGNYSQAIQARIAYSHVAAS